MASAADIRERAVKKLGLRSLSQTTRSEIATDIDQAYTEVYAMLSVKSLTPWDFDEAVPDEFAKPVVDLVADARKDEYSIPGERYLRITLDARGDGTEINRSAIAVIKDMQASNVYKTPPADYF